MSSLNKQHRLGRKLILHKVLLEQQYITLLGSCFKALCNTVVVHLTSFYTKSLTSHVHFHTCTISKVVQTSSLFCWSLADTVLILKGCPFIIDINPERLSVSLLILTQKGWPVNYWCYPRKTALFIIDINPKGSPVHYWCYHRKALLFIIDVNLEILSCSLLMLTHKGCAVHD